MLPFSLAHETLLLQSQIAQLKHPENRVLAAVKYFFERPHHKLGGKAKTFLNHPSDLAALKKEIARDGLSYFARFNERTISRTVNVVTILMAAIFLIGPVLALNFTRDPIPKLVMISLFTVFFASSVYVRYAIDQ
ncbi:hypothetical protein F4809DRAFT_644215 [Biscogniauxia mediterranea]|nr:hypothetical protein F4809DRAFT_644215 [Biscogniauxia mediterranea]